MEMDFTQTEYIQERPARRLEPQPVAVTAEELTRFITEQTTAARVTLAGAVTRREITREEYERKSELWTRALAVTRQYADLCNFVDGLRLQIEEVRK